MMQRGEDYWRKAIVRQKTSGMSAAKFCVKHHLSRGTFLRWRKRLSETDQNENGFVEIKARRGLDGTLSGSGLTLRVGMDVWIAVPPGADMAFVSSLIAAIRSAV